VADWNGELGKNRQRGESEAMENDHFDRLQFSIVAPVWNDKATSGDPHYPYRIVRITLRGRPRHFLLESKRICSPGALRRALLAQGATTIALSKRDFFQRFMHFDDGLDFERCRVPIEEAQAFCDRLNQDQISSSSNSDHTSG